MSERPPDAIMSPDGTAGWYAYLPDGRRPSETDGVAPEGPREGSLIRLMGEVGVDVPLWSEGGLLFGDRDELVREWELSDELVSDLVAWALAWSSESGEPGHDAEGARLTRRLRRELDHRFLVVFHP